MGRTAEVGSGLPIGECQSQDDDSDEDRNRHPGQLRDLVHGVTQVQRSGRTDQADKYLRAGLDGRAGWAYKSSPHHHGWRRNGRLPLSIPLAEPQILQDRDIVLTEIFPEERLALGWALAHGDV